MQGTDAGKGIGNSAAGGGEDSGGTKRQGDLVEKPVFPHKHLSNVAARSSAPGTSCMKGSTAAHKADSKQNKIDYANDVEKYHTDMCAWRKAVKDADAPQVEAGSRSANAVSPHRHTTALGGGEGSVRSCCMFKLFTPLSEFE